MPKRGRARTPDDEGLTRGDIWWLRHHGGPRPGRPKPKHTREEMVEAALRVADLDGWEALSMRRVATELGMGTMSLYWYVESKDDLLDLIWDQLMGDFLLEPAELADWRSGFALLASRMRSLFIRRPWALSLIGQRNCGPNAARHLDQSIRLAERLSDDPADQLVIIAVVDNFVIGHCVHERETVVAQREAGGDETAAREATAAWLRDLAADEGLDRLAMLLDRPAPAVDHDEIFRLGLETVLDGLTSRYVKTRRRSGS